MKMKVMKIMPQEKMKEPNTQCPIILFRDNEKIQENLGLNQKMLMKF